MTEYQKTLNLVVTESEAKALTSYFRSLLQKAKDEGQHNGFLIKIGFLTKLVSQLDWVPKKPEKESWEVAKEIESRMDDTQDHIGATLQFLEETFDAETAEVEYLPLANSYGDFAEKWHDILEEKRLAEEAEKTCAKCHAEVTDGSLQWLGPGNIYLCETCSNEVDRD